MEIKLLTQNEWQSWKNIRLEALKNMPEAFGSSFEEESNLLDNDFQETLNKNNVFGAFHNDELIGCAAFRCLNSVKTRHRGILWGMYIKPEYRGVGVADNLLKTIILFAKTKVVQLHLTCVANNNSAVKFYLRNGFEIYGTASRALQIDKQYYDELLMVLTLC